MNSSLRDSASPAMLVALIALLAALSGTAIALPGTGTVDSGDVKNSSIRGEDLRESTITARELRGRSLDGTDIKINRVGGDAVKEEGLEVDKLAKVPAAATADLLGGQTVAQIVAAAQAGGVKGDTGAQGPQGPAGGPGAPGPPGAPGADGADGGPVAYAKVFGSSESVLPTQSKNISDTDIVKEDNGAGPIDGAYCISSSPTGIKSAAVTSADSGFRVASVSVLGSPHAGCPAGTDARVKLYDPIASGTIGAPVLVDGTFYIWLTD